MTQQSPVAWKEVQGSSEQTDFIAPVAVPEDAAAPRDLASPIQGTLHEVHAKYRVVHAGAVANYIPELAKVDPDQFGIAIVTADGHLYEIGDSRSPFTIQSISKALVYGLALSDHGRDAVLKRIGVEPSGDPFNAILFDERNNRPFNPMVNAGAIAATALIRGANPAARMERILGLFRAFCGRELVIDEAVYRSEATSGHRNRAIAYLELNTGMIEGDAEAHLDLYFRQCSILATAADLAFMGATLANGGIHPITGERALESEHVRDVLSVMTTCGMYDYAGEWELRVGLPAKSGVGGGIMAVLPGQLGLGVFSPRLDDRGNSARGIRVCEELSNRLKLHLLDHRGTTRSAVRRVYRGSDVRSKRLRTVSASQTLDAKADAIVVFELHGNLFFGNTEQMIRRILADEGASHVILDVSRVAMADVVAVQLLRDLERRLGAAGTTLLIAGAAADLPDRLGVDKRSFRADVDAALEYCEDALLERDPPADAGAPVPLAAFEILEELNPQELLVLADHLVRRNFPAGETLISEGSEADALYFLLGGSVEICIISAGDSVTTRLGVIDPGNVFGELALLGMRRRTADVVTASPATVLMLDAARIASLSTYHPVIRAKLVAAVGRSLAERLRRTNAVIRALTR